MCTLREFFIGNVVKDKLLRFFKWNYPKAESSRTRYLLVVLQITLLNFLAHAQITKFEAWKAWKTLALSSSVTISSGALLDWKPFAPKLIKYTPPRHMLVVHLRASGNLLVVQNFQICSSALPHFRSRLELKVKFRIKFVLQKFAPSISSKKKLKGFRVLSSIIVWYP